jgi:glycerophosphoryl diester phosphodiesterase
MLPSRAPSGFAYLDPPRPRAFAHRGGALEADENTMAAFAHAAGLGYGYLETDVRASRDGVAVVFHDATLERMTGDPHRIEALTWGELSCVRTRIGHALPRLDELLDAFPNMRINIDPKSDDVVEPMAEAIRRCDAVGRVCVGSFDERRTARARARLGEAMCWSPSHGGVARLWLAGFHLPVGSTGFPAVQVPPRHYGIPVVTRRFVSAAHARGIEVHVWTVDEAEEMSRLLALGVDGLMTDRPSLLKQVLVERGQWHGN